jgi:hypothetical protein
MVTTTDHHVKCTKLLVPIVEMKQKFPSNQMENDLCTVKIATKSENQEDIKLLNLGIIPNRIIFFSYNSCFFFFIIRINQ